MYWLSLLSSALALSITKQQAAIRNVGDKVELEYTSFDQALEIGPDQTLDVKFTFSGEGLPRQAFVSVKGPSGKYHAASAKIRKNIARATLPFENFEEGVSEARAYIAGDGGKDISVPLKITASPAKKAKEEKVNRKEKFAEQNKINYDLKPEILHEFKAPPRMVSAPVALVFAGAVWVLFFGLVAAWNSQIGLQFGAVPFVGSLAAIEAVFLGYYYKLSIFSAIFYSVLIGGVAAYLGNKALRTLPDVKSTEPPIKEQKEVKENKKDSKKGK